MEDLTRELRQVKQELKDKQEQMLQQHKDAKTGRETRNPKPETLDAPGRETRNPKPEALNARGDVQTAHALTSPLFRWPCYPKPETVNRKPPLSLALPPSTLNSPLPTLHSPLPTSRSPLLIAHCPLPGLRFKVYV